MRTGPSVDHLSDRVKEGGLRAETMMEFREAPSAGWDQRIASPMLTEGFAEASCRLGYRPLFVEDHRDRALVLLRRIPLLCWIASPSARRFT